MAARRRPTAHGQDSPIADRRVTTYPPFANRAKSDRAGAFVDQLEAALDPVQPLIDVVEPDVHAGEIDVQVGELALDAAEADDHLIEFPVMLVEFAADRRSTIFAGQALSGKERRGPNGCASRSRSGAPPAPLSG
jgi:hypothetical protein